MSMAVDGFPNMFLVYGPGSGLNSGTIMSLLEHQALYVTKCVMKLQRERLKSMETKVEATRDWVQHLRVRTLIVRYGPYTYCNHHPSIISPRYRAVW